jgi:hypothetical protein
MINEKTLWRLFAIFLIAIVFVLNINIHTNENERSDVSLDNIEALAQEVEFPGCVSAKGYCIRNEYKFNI